MTVRVMVTVGMGNEGEGGHEGGGGHEGEGEG
jgi:hypothetical protein